MVRAIALTGMAGGFMMISPNLRVTVFEGMTQAVEGIERYSPFSYVGLVLMFLVAFLFFMRAASAPR